MHSGRRSDLLLNKNKTRESEFSLRTAIRRSILGQYVDLVEYRYLDVRTDN